MDLASEHPQEGHKDCYPCFFMTSTEQRGEFSECCQVHYRGYKKWPPCSALTSDPSPLQCRTKQVCGWTSSSPKSARDPRADCQQQGPNTQLLPGVGYAQRTTLESYRQHQAPLCSSDTRWGRAPWRLFPSMGNTAYVWDRGRDWIRIPARCHLQQACLLSPKKRNISAEDELNYLLHLI